MDRYGHGPVLGTVLGGSPPSIISLGSGGGENPQALRAASILALLGINPDPQYEHGNVTVTKRHRGRLTWRLEKPVAVPRTHTEYSRRASVLSTLQRGLCTSVLRRHLFSNALDPGCLVDVGGGFDKRRGGSSLSAAKGRNSRLFSVEHSA